MSRSIREKMWIAIVVTLCFLVTEAGAQCTFGTPDCQASLPANNNATLFTLGWTHNSGPACPITGDTSYGGNLKASVLGNNTTLTISTNFTVNGDFQMTNSGSSSTLIVPAGVTFHVTGNLGDCTNNNVNFQVDGILIVDGYISGKNSNAFSGSGSITATGGLFFNNGVSCPNPCNITWNVGSCVPSGSAFCTLPLQLASFDASVNANGVHIRWITESENHVDFMTLEKSVDGKEFFPLSDFAAHNGAPQHRVYGYLDEHAWIGKSYYRLKETDLDGAGVYHRIVGVEYNGGRLLDVFPVPVSDGILHLRTNFQTPSDSRITISNVTGAVIHSSLLKVGEPMKVHVNLDPGIYILRYWNGDFQAVKRIVVQ